MKKKREKSSHLEFGLYSDLPLPETVATLSIALCAYAWFIWKWFDLSTGLCKMQRWKLGQK